MQIPLGRNKYALVDDDQKDLLAHRWWLMYSGVGVNLRYYAGRTEMRNGVTTRIRMHRLIAEAPEQALVDHINGDTLDNRRANLRCVTASENQQNRQGAARHSRTGIRGVYWEERKQRFVAQVKIGGRKVYRASFRSREEAEQAVIAARARIMTHSRENTQPA